MPVPSSPSPTERKQHEVASGFSQVARSSKRPIGFITPRPSKTLAASPDPEQQLLIFDEGAAVSLSEATHNLCAIGGIGRGKTSCIVSPASDTVLKAGFGGLIIDVKNNFTDQIRSLARLYGRERDIIELGDLPTATPINLLAGLTVNEIHSLLNTLVMAGIEFSANADWHQKGVSIAADCAQLVRFLEEFEDVELSIGLLQSMIADYALSRKMMKRFLEEHFNDQREDHVQFVHRLENVAFHVFSSPKQPRDFDQQMTWNLQRIRQILAQLSDTTDLWNNINQGPELNIADLVYKQHKIIVLRFSPGVPAAGAILARLTKERFYRAVYSNGLSSLEEGQYTFAIMDEFQDIMDLDSDSNMNDFSWFSKSREFRNINVIATQSMSSLYGCSRNRDAVVSLLNNCSTKIVLQLEDPETLSWLHLVDQSLNPTRLGLGRALLLKYDLSLRAFSSTEQGVQNCHDDTQKKLNRGKTMLADDSVADPQLSQTNTADFMAMIREQPDFPLLGDSSNRHQKTPINLSKALAPWPATLDFYERFKAYFEDDIKPEDIAIPPGWMSLVNTTMEYAERLKIPFKISSLGMLEGQLTILASGNYSPVSDVFYKAGYRSYNICMICGKKMNRRRTKKNGKMTFLRKGNNPPVCRECSKGQSSYP